MQLFRFHPRASGRCEHDQRDICLTAIGQLLNYYFDKLAVGVSIKMRFTPTAAPDVSLARRFDMADKSAKMIANMARVLAIVHIIIGFLLLAFGIADLVVMLSWSGYPDPCFGIWIGVWVSKFCFMRKCFVILKACKANKLQYLCRISIRSSQR